MNGPGTSWSSSPSEPWVAGLEGSPSRRWSRPELCSLPMKGAGGEPRAHLPNLLGFQIRSI